MKNKITFLTMMLLATLFAIGQSHLFQTDRNFPQNPTLKSSLETKQQLDSLVTQIWDETNNQWVIGYKEGFIYDGNARLIQDHDYEWDETNNAWEINEKNEYTYDANGNISEILTYDWDENNNQLVQDHKEEFTYDGSGKLIEDFDYRWDDLFAQWIFTHKNEYNYDALGNLSQRFYYGWDEISSQWEPNWKNEYIYGANDNLWQKLHYDWEAFSSQWVLNGKNEYSYDEDGYLTQVMGYDWDEPNNQWVFSDKDENTYDAEGNLVQSIIYGWDESNSQWEPFLKEEYTYDDSYTFSNLIIPYYFEDELGFSNHKLESIIAYLWDEAGSDWIEFSKSVLHYSEQNVGLNDELGIAFFGVYPNPFSENFSLHFSGIPGQLTFSLFDIKGCKIFSKEIRYGETLNMEGLNYGMYFYSINLNGKRLNGKLIKL